MAFSINSATIRAKPIHPCSHQQHCHRLFFSDSHYLIFLLSSSLLRAFFRLLSIQFHHNGELPSPLAHRRKKWHPLPNKKLSSRPHPAPSPVPKASLPTRALAVAQVLPPAPLRVSSVRRRRLPLVVPGPPSVAVRPPITRNRCGMRDRRRRAPRAREARQARC